MTAPMWVENIFVYLPFSVMKQTLKKKKSETEFISNNAFVCSRLKCGSVAHRVGRVLKTKARGRFKSQIGHIHFWPL